MTLAESLADHLSEAPLGFGAMLGAEFALARLVRSKIGQQIRIADGVSMAFLAMPTWRTATIVDGVALQFETNKPKILARKLGVSLEADVSGIRLCIVGDSVRLTLELDRFPDFDVEIRL